MWLLQIGGFSYLRQFHIYIHMRQQFRITMPRHHQRLFLALLIQTTTGTSGWPGDSTNHGGDSGLANVDVRDVISMTETTPMHSVVTTSSPQLSFLTSIFTSSATPVLKGGGDIPIAEVDIIVIATVTFLQPTGANSFPTAAVITAITDGWTTIIMNSDGTSHEYASTLHSTYTDYTTWSLFAPQPTDMAPHGVPFCNECPSLSAPSDPRCDEMGLPTACYAQCNIRDGLRWCLQFGEGITPMMDGIAMGRACWGSLGYIKALTDLCIDGVYAMSRPSCLLSRLPYKWCDKHIGHLYSIVSSSLGRPLNIGTIPFDELPLLDPPRGPASYDPFQ